MSRATRARHNTRQRATRDRETRVDFKLHRIYHTREAAEADLDRLLDKAQTMLDTTASEIFHALRYQDAAIEIEEIDAPESDVPTGGDYHSMLITKERNRGAAVWSYEQGADGSIESGSFLHAAPAPDPLRMPDYPEPHDPAPGGEYEPRPDLASEYDPLTGPDGKRDPARRYIHHETGEIISRRAHMKLRGIRPETPASQRGKRYRTTISYGVATHGRG